MDLVPSLGILATVQSTEAGANLDGTAPAGAATDSNRVRTYAPGAGGGLFEFDPVLSVVEQIRIHLPGGTGYAVSIRRADGSTDDQIAGATGLSAVNGVLQGPWWLTSGEKLKIVTTGAAGQNKAYAKVIHRPWQRVTY